MKPQKHRAHFCILVIYGDRDMIIKCVVKNGLDVGSAYGPITVCTIINQNRYLTELAYSQRYSDLN